jgi:hypothetical protein
MSRLCFGFLGCPITTKILFSMGSWEGQVVQNSMLIPQIGIKHSQAKNSECVY